MRVSGVEREWNKREIYVYGMTEEESKERSLTDEASVLGVSREHRRVLVDIDIRTGDINVLIDDSAEFGMWYSMISNSQNRFDTYAAR